jgi:glycosyltransferase involved in cell wall biosynthesis
METTKKHISNPVSVILPAYNEEEGIFEQIETIRHVLLSHEIEHEIIVVDDGSGDRTAELAVQARARVFRHQQNKGYGAALKTGIVGAQYDMIVIIDADGTYPADQLPNMIAKLENADMVVGARIGEKIHVPLIRRPAKWILSWLAARITGQKIPDLNSGLRAFRRNCVKQYFSILPNRFSFTTTITLAMLNDNYFVIFHPINYYKRIGRSKIVPYHFLEFMILVFRIAMLFQPLKIFVPLAFSCICLGILKVIYDTVTLFIRASNFSWSLLYQPALSTSAILLLLFGLQLLLIGMVADSVLTRIDQYNRSLKPPSSISTSQTYPKNAEREDNKI